MLYHQINPHPLLKDLIRCYWIMDGSCSRPVEHKVIADYCMDIIRDNTNGETIVAGSACGHYVLNYTGNVSIFGIRFYPGAFFNLFHIPASEFCGKVVPIADTDLNNTIPQNITSAYDADRFFLSHFAGVCLDTFSSELNAAGRSFTTEYSRKTVNRRMAERVGFTFGAYSQILSVHKSIKLMLNGRYEQAEIAQMSGFYDQSHFIRIFKKHTGASPLSFLKDIKSSPVRFIQYPMGMF